MVTDAHFSKIAISHYPLGVKSSNAHQNLQKLQVYICSTVQEVFL